MRYKVGDKVRIKSLDWYYENRDKIDQIDCGNVCFVHNMATLCGEIVTISSILPTLEAYRIEEDDSEFNWTDEMIERLVERNGKTYPYKIGDRVVLKGKNRCATIIDLKYDSFGNLSYYINIDNDKDNSIVYPTDLLLPYDNKVEGLVKEEVGLVNKFSSRWVNEFNLPEGYIFKDENGNVINTTKIVLEKKNKYPKTYEECCKVLGIPIHGGIALVGNWCMEDGYIVQHLETLRALSKLLICRDAYWKIVGEEMGLGKPWEPTMETVYCISRNDNVIKCLYRDGKSNILEFPIEEMRDVFYENFKELIESCKELL